MKKFGILFASIASLGIISACSSDESGSSTDVDQNETVSVVSTIGQLNDIVENVGGEHVSAEGLMGPGVDPHSYNASQGDISRLDDADLVFFNALNLEANMEDILRQMGNDKPVYAVGEHVPEELIKQDEEETNMPDPHIWFDIDLWVYAVDAVKEGLIEVDPENEADYTANAEAYVVELRELQEWAYEEVDTIPEDQRVLVTAHDAFQYFGAAFDFDVLGLQGISTDAEYGLSDVQRVISEMIDRDIHAVFGETSVSDSSIEAVIQGANEQGHEVEHGGELYSDAMGESGSDEETYIGMYRSNISQIVDALQ
ncbi:metal ABC transporter solute-binding protein, Zn/Mn family [Geomicrobium sp. JCM 19055]|uniref:metal ABC transporter solute-binding protein, Zn/Mn family n=1 Tax=Geomicrobium sp. JCM 19055 TaxID=1460649 RepID=UPI00045EDD97|nr:zinc ABC transporter substrate-binding protein [Geomicrobium sp. JCM 19055]GAJ99288.1 manganese ABC transporter, periplasmic-binding protein SitA [Geomicrobium sp. JCM 19055]